jgi:hypothetical protein
MMRHSVLAKQMHCWYNRATNVLVLIVDNLCIIDFLRREMHFLPGVDNS